MLVITWARFVMGIRFGTFVISLSYNKKYITILNNVSIGCYLRRSKYK